eukprot:9159146-Pyramimonas_sp.AAC.1
MRQLNNMIGNRGPPRRHAVRCRWPRFAPAHGLFDGDLQMSATPVLATLLRVHLLRLTIIHLHGVGPLRKQSTKAKGRFWIGLKSQDASRKF